MVTLRNEETSEKVEQILFAIEVATTQWHWVEHGLTELLSLLLGAREDMASAVLDAVPCFQTKILIVRAAAAVCLADSSILDDWDELSKGLENQARKRHEITHSTLYQLPRGEQPFSADWYLSPSPFDSGCRWSHQEPSPLLKADDLMDYARAFIEAGSKLQQFNEKVRGVLRHPPKFRQSFSVIENNEPMSKKDEMHLKLKLSDIQDRLPEAGQRWITGMSSAEQHGTEIILNNVGVESFLKHWKEYRDELAEIRKL